MALRVGGLLLVASVLGSGVFVPTSAHASAPVTSSAVAIPRVPIGLDISGSFTQASRLRGLVTGVPAPGPSGQPDGVLVTIRVNGVTVELPPLQWNPDGEWEFEYYLPAGSAGSIVSITVIGPSGLAIGRSFTVGL